MISVLSFSVDSCELSQAQKLRDVDYVVRDIKHCFFCLCAH